MKYQAWSYLVGFCVLLTQNFGIVLAFMKVLLQLGEQALRGERFIIGFLPFA